MNGVSALAAGFALDLLLGDPPWLPHPVVAIGRATARLEAFLRGVLPATPRGELAGGAILAAVVAGLSFFAPFAALAALAEASPAAAWLFECAVCYQVLATKCLRDAAMRVYGALAGGDLAEARRAAGMIVGRDTGGLDAGGVARAAVETVAENASDGVVAPMLFFAVGGAPLALLYKAVNTMDSMLGYKNEKYLHFGRAAARLDDAANYAPARLTAALMVPAAMLTGLDWRGALRIWLRDGSNHASPNSGHPEAACAGALGIRLGGNSLYGGKLVAKPTLGEPRREIEPGDIRRACRLLYGVAALCFALCLALAALKGRAWN